MFQVFANCPEDMGPGEIAARAVRAEAMGYDGRHGSLGVSHGDEKFLMYQKKASSVRSGRYLAAFR